MARPLRLQLPDGWYHVTARGIERREIYRNASDYQHWLDLLGTVPERFGLKVLAYVQMPNHYHLLVDGQTPGLSQAMQWLNVSYSVWFNRKYGRVGPLFQGRFKAIAVERLEWGLRLSRYVHLNPVHVKRLGLGKANREMLRAGVSGEADPRAVRHRLNILRNYHWSSYRSYIGLAPTPGWLRTTDVIELLGGRVADQRAGYRRYVEEATREGLGEAPWEELKAGLVLGSKQFVGRVARLAKGDRREQTALRRLEGRVLYEDVVRAVERIKGESWEAFAERHGDWGRDMVLYLSRKYTGLTLRTLGQKAGGMDYIAVSVAVRRIGDKLAQDHTLSKAAARIEGQL